jgi:hypothetical protein
MRSKPHYWFWSHDIEPNQIDGLTMPGMRLQRLVNYRRVPRPIAASPRCTTTMRAPSPRHVPGSLTRTPPLPPHTPHKQSR